MNPNLFTDALEMALELTIGDQSFKVPGANIKRVNISLRPYGYKVGLRFWLSSVMEEDKLFPEFIKHDLIKSRLKVSPHFKPKKGEVEPLELHGLVRKKAILNELTIENVHLEGQPVLYRYYQIDFADPARVLWAQHFPCDLQVDATLRDLIEANKTTGVDLKYDWDILETEFAINTLPGRSGEKGSSFYDFICWLSSSHNGVFTYNCIDNEYTLAGDKNTSGKTVVMSKLETKSHSIVFPETIRFNDRLLNVFSENPQTDGTSRDEAEDNLRCDMLVRHPISSDYNEAFDLESGKQKIRGHEIHVTHCRYPQITYRSNVFVKFEKGLWSEEIFPHGTEYRVRDIYIQAWAVDEGPDADHNLGYSRYNMEMRSHLELKDEKALNVPPFKEPSFPIIVEGKIVSEQGRDEEKTYQIYEHPQTTLDQYRVKIPLFEDKEVVVPYEPLLAPGHFYFPAYKDERVMVALDFHSAWIERFLDWRPGGRLPMDTQGNHLLLGKTDSDKTSINHVYKDNRPQLNVQRTYAGDTEKIQLHEGRIVIETKEE